MERKARDGILRNRLPFYGQYAILKLRHKTEKDYSVYGVRTAFRISISPYAESFVSQQSEILMQGVSSIEGTLFYFWRVCPVKNFWEEILCNANTAAQK